MKTVDNLQYGGNIGMDSYLNLAVMRRDGELPVLAASPLAISVINHEAVDFEYEATEPYELPLERNEGVRPGNCCRNAETVDEICLECHLALFA